MTYFSDIALYRLKISNRPYGGSIIIVIIIIIIIIIIITQV